jgi:hypothetical protein
VGWMIKKPRNHPSISGREKFSLIVRAQTPSEADPASCSVHTLGKWLGQKANYLSLSSTRVKNVWSCVCSTSTPLYSLTVCCLIKKWKQLYLIKSVN